MCRATTCIFEYYLQLLLAAPWLDDRALNGDPACIMCERWKQRKSNWLPAGLVNLRKKKKNYTFRWHRTPISWDHYARNILDHAKSSNLRSEQPMVHADQFSQLLSPSRTRLLKSSVQTSPEHTRTRHFFA